MAHHYYYLHIRSAQIPGSLKNDIYRELYHTAPQDLVTKYAQLRNRFGLANLEECRMLMFAVMDYWVQRCKLVKLCLDSTKLLPIRVEWIDSVFEGTKFGSGSRPRSLEGGREVDEYGWAVEMVRAERVFAFTENCSLIFIGDNTSGLLARYIEWGKWLSDMDGRFQRRFENSEWKFEECERLSVLVHVLQKMHFGNGCVAVVLSSGAHELAEGMPPGKYAELLKVILTYLLQFQLRIIVVPPTPRTENQLLWFQYVMKQQELSTELPDIEFLVMSNRHAGGRSFLDAMVMGGHALDLHICDNTGFTGYGIKKLSFFLIEVILIPKTAIARQNSEAERTHPVMNPKEMPVMLDYDEYKGAPGMEQAPRFIEAQKQGWYPPSLEYEPIEEVPPLSNSYGLPVGTELLPADITYIKAKNYSELAGYPLTAQANPVLASSSGIGNAKSRRRRKKKNNGGMEERMAVQEAQRIPHKTQQPANSNHWRQRQPQVGKDIKAQRGVSGSQPWKRRIFATPLDRRRRRQVHARHVNEQMTTN